MGLFPKSPRIGSLSLLPRPTVSSGGPPSSAPASGWSPSTVTATGPCPSATACWGQLLRLIYFFSKTLIGGLSGVNLRIGAKIGRRFHIHTFHAIHIGNGVTIGDDCVVNSGSASPTPPDGRGNGMPRIGRRVRLGMGCKVLGGIAIGDYSIVGANAVVTATFPR
jgi:serine acetyltransferase